MAVYDYSVTAVNYNGGYSNAATENSYQLDVIGTVMIYSSITITEISIQLTIEGFYILIINNPG